VANSAKAIANYLLDRAAKDGIGLTQMQLHKMLYYVQGWHLGLIGEPLFPEAIEAWRHGPVINSVYQEFKQYGAKPIKESAVDIEMSEEGQIIIHECKADLNPKSKSITDQVYELYKKYSASELRALTHKPGTPWRETWKDGESEFRGDVIPTDLIKSYFKSLKNK